MTNTPIATVFVREGSVYANSRDVAAYFEKRHDHVLRDIDELIENLGGKAANPCDSHTPQSWGVWFREVTTEQKVGFGTRLNRAFIMTRDGFTLLAMGFTGPRALKFKLAYITAFTAMEEELRERDEEAETISAMPEAEARKIVDLARKVHGLKQAQQLWFALGLPFVPLSLEHQPQTEMVFTATLTAANQNGRYLAA